MMEAPLIERLNKMYEYLIKNGLCGEGVDMMKEAADEIEYLTALLGPIAEEKRNAT